MLNAYVTLALKIRKAHACDANLQYPVSRSLLLLEEASVARMAKLAEE